MIDGDVIGGGSEVGVEEEEGVCGVEAATIRRELLPLRKNIRMEQGVLCGSFVGNSFKRRESSERIYEISLM